METNAGFQIIIIIFSCTIFNLRCVKYVHLSHMYIDQQLKNNTDRMHVAFSVCCYVMDSLKEDRLVVCRLSMLILLDFVV